MCHGKKRVIKHKNIQVDNMVWTRGNCSFRVGYLLVKKNLPLSIWLSSHPSPPLPPMSLPPPSVGAVLVLENLYPSIQCIWRAKHSISMPKERKTQRAEPLPPLSPIFTGCAHAPDPAHPRNRPTGSAHLSMQRRTNKPPSTVCSVSHPSLFYNTFTVRPSSHAPRRPSALMPRGHSRDFIRWGGLA